MIEITAHGQSKGECSAKITIAEMLLNGELTKSEDTEGVYCKSCADELKMQDVVKLKAGTPREGYEPLYNCENWIP